jgi:dienelactone hydrolase
MNTRFLNYAIVLFALVASGSCGNNEVDKHDESSDSSTKQTAAERKVTEEAVTYAANDITFHGYVGYDQNQQGKRPAVLVVHEWWGLTDYVRNRVKQLADMGYIAMAVDMFGDGKTAANPQEAQKLAGPFYQDPSLTRARLEAALNRLKQYEQVDPGRVAAIGYCYGGYVVLNAAKLGMPLTGVVSFHGNLAGAPANKELLRSKVLVCHGEADQFISQQEISSFRSSMDSIGADYTFKTYPNATHAFTNPAATATGKEFNLPISYNAEADRASWTDMKLFFEKIFN